MPAVACCWVTMGAGYMQEVAKILSDALPEYKFKAHKQGEKKQFIDSSKVTCWNLMLLASVSCTCSDALPN